MSTKIHNGYKIAVTSIAELSAFNAEAKQRLRAKADELVAAITATAAVDILDRFNLRLLKSGENSPDLPLAQAAYATYREMQLKCRKNCSREPSFDLDFWWRFHLMPSGQVYAIIGCEQPQFIEVWKAMPQCLHYPYWNHTDQPDGMTWEEWTARGDEWDAACKQPLLAHNLFEDWNSPRMPAIEAIVTAQPAHEKRVAKFAHKAAFDEIAASIPDEVVEASRKSMSFGWIYDVEEKIRDTDEGREVLRRHTDRIRDILPISYKETDFSANLSNGAEVKHG